MRERERERERDERKPSKLHFSAPGYLIIYPPGADMEVNKRGIQAVEEVLKEARRLARGLPPEKREAIEKMCTEIEALMTELAELQAKGQVSCG